MPAPSRVSFSTLAVSATCPRAMRCRSSSRTSPSHLPNAPGSLMLGLKKRWLTVRISTLTPAAPTMPSADPKPVMLDIIRGRQRYEPPEPLSIGELPPQAIYTYRVGHVKARNDLVNIVERIA